MLQSWLHLDWIGTVFSLAAVTFLLVAIQWGGNEKPWNNGLVIAFLVLVSPLFFLVFILTCHLSDFQAIVFIIAFVLWEYRCGERALLPVHMLVQKNVVCASLSAVRNLIFFCWSVCLHRGPYSFLGTFASTYSL